VTTEIALNFGKLFRFPVRKYHSRYTDSLWVGRSGDRISVGVRFSAPVQIGHGAHPAYYTLGTGSFRGGGGKARGTQR
jgi:hypothetical protein